MKTPREFLFERHRKTDEKLDAIRANVLRAEVAHATRHTPHDGLLSALTHQLAAAYCQLFLPARRVWLGFAAAWLFMFAANLSFRAGAPHIAAATPVRSPDFLRALHEQQQLMAELIERPRPKAVEGNKPAAPQPRSDLRNEMLNAQNV